MNVRGFFGIVYLYILSGGIDMIKVNAVGNDYDSGSKNTGKHWMDQMVLEQ